MKRRLILILLLASALSFVCAADLFAQRWFFDSRDVEGTWYIHNYMSTPTWTGWAYGHITFDGAGKVIGGRGTTHDGYNLLIRGGRYRLRTSGLFTATLYCNEHNGNPVVLNVKGTMNMGKDTITTVDVNSRQSPSLTIMVKSPEGPPLYTMN